MVTKRQLREEALLIYEHRTSTGGKPQGSLMITAAPPTSTLRNRLFSQPGAYGHMPSRVADTFVDPGDTFSVIDPGADLTNHEGLDGANRVYDSMQFPPPQSEDLDNVDSPLEEYSFLRKDLNFSWAIDKSVRTRTSRRPT